MAGFVTGVDALSGNRALDNREGAKSKCITSDRVMNLQSYGELRSNDFLMFGHLTAEDSVRSILFVAPPGVTAHFFNDRGWDGDQKFQPHSGEFSLTAGPTGVVRVNALQPVPQVEPPDAWCTWKPPSGWLLSPNDRFDRQLSAVGFAPVTTTFHSERVDNCEATSSSTQMLTARTPRPQATTPSRPAGIDTTIRPVLPERTTAPPLPQVSSAAPITSTAPDKPAAPQARILKPRDGQEFGAERSDGANRYYAEVPLQAEVTSGKKVLLRWTTTADEDGDGQVERRDLGAGESLTTKLYTSGTSPTEHTITLTATDDAGRSSTSTVTVLVEYMPG